MMIKHNLGGTMVHRLITCAVITYLLISLIGCKHIIDSDQTQSDPNIIIVAVKGTVDAIDNSLGLLDSSVSKGSSITAVYKLKVAATPSPYSQPHSTDYLDAFEANAVVITVGNYTFKSGPLTQLTMVDGGTSADGIYDGWYVYLPSSTVVGPAINANLTGFINLYDPSAAALSSTALLPVPKLKSWSSKRIGIARQDDRGSHLFIAGEITELSVIQ
jgi:hypothetical protein